MTIVHKHPDGHEIYFEHGELTSVTAEGNAVSIPLGSPANVLELAAKLQEIASDAGNQAEQAGAESAIDALTSIARTSDQGERIAALQSAIMAAIDCAAELLAMHIQDEPEGAYRLRGRHAEAVNDAAVCASMAAYNETRGLA